MKSAKDYRAAALDKLRGNWKPYVLTSLALIAVVVVAEIPVMLTDILHMSRLAQLYAQLLLFGVFLCVYFPLCYSYFVSFVDKFRGHEASFDNRVFFVFCGEYGRGVGAYLLIAVLAYLILIPLCLIALVATVCLMPYIYGVELTELSSWIAENEMSFTAIMMDALILCLIPLMIWAYSVRLTPYLVHEHPEVGVYACLKESRRLMKGHKWQLFCLEMSFMGWALLSVFTLFIGMLWLMPYQSMATAAFYKDVLAEAEAQDGAEL